MTAPMYSAVHPLVADGPRLVQTVSGIRHRCIGHTDSQPLAEFLAEAHNAYVPALRELVGLIHRDAIPDAWRQDGAPPLTLGDVVKRLAELLPADSVGAPPEPRTPGYDHVDVTFPGRWRVLVSDGNVFHPDEPSVKVPAGTYLIGYENDPGESDTIVLRAERSLDPHTPGVTDRQVLEQLATFLADNIAALDPAETAGASA